MVRCLLNIKTFTHTLHYILCQQTNTPLKHSFCWICPLRPSQSSLLAGPPWPLVRSDWSCSAWRKNKKYSCLRNLRRRIPRNKLRYTKDVSVSVSLWPEGLYVRSLLIEVTQPVCTMLQFNVSFPFLGMKHDKNFSLKTFKQCVEAVNSIYNFSCKHNALRNVRNAT